MSTTNPPGDHRRFHQMEPGERAGVLVRLAGEWSMLTCLLALCLAGLLLLGALGALTVPMLLRSLF